MHIISETRGFISALFNGSTAVLTVVFAQNVPRSKRRLELSHRQPPAREDQEPPCNGAKHQNGIADKAKCISGALGGCPRGAESRLGKIDESSGLDGCDATAV